MRLDLSGRVPLSADHARLLDRVAEELRRPFVEMIEGLSVRAGRNIDWWVSELASRNTYTSSLFEDCCRVEFVRRILEQNSDITEIVVPRRDLSTVLRAEAREASWKVTIVTDRRIRAALRDGFAPFRAYAVTLVFVVCYRILARLLRPSRPLRVLHNAVFLDTFVLNSSFDKGSYEDRYYRGFAGALTERERKGIVYVPTLLTSVGRSMRIFRALRRAPENFVIKEQYLTASDYLFALSYPFRALRLRPPSTMLNSIDVTPLLRGVWYRHLGSASSVDGLLKFRFARGLKRAGVRPRLVIDWFENQIIDKGANAGFKWFYPDVPIIGYQGFFVPRHYLCMYPTQSEWDSAVLPDVVAVTGRALVEGRKEFLQGLEVVTAPAFRFSDVWRDSQLSNGKTGTVLVTLHLTTRNAVELLQAVARAASRVAPHDVRFWIKPHPGGRSCSELMERARVDGRNFVIVETEFSDLLSQCDVVCTNTSSTGVQAVARGVPVIIVGSRTGLTQNPIPDAAPAALWKLCYTDMELADAILEFVGRPPSIREKQVALSREFREAYFEPVTTSSVRRFLRL